MLDLPRTKASRWMHTWLGPSCAVAWLGTAGAEFFTGSFFSNNSNPTPTDGSSIPAQAVFSAAVFATALLQLLYFLTQWSQGVLTGNKKVPYSNPLLVAWLMMTCSTIVCMVGIIGFGVAGLNQVVSTVFKGAPHAWMGWLPPLVFVSMAAVGATWMLIGLLAYYARYLRFDDIAATEAKTPAEVPVTEQLEGCGFLRWRTYFDFAILVFVGLGITTIRLIIGADTNSLMAAVELSLSLVFGIYVVGLYASGVHEYLNGVGQLLGDLRKNKNSS